MSETRQFLNRLFALGRGRDGESRVLEQDARRNDEAERPAQGLRRQRLGMQPQRIVMESLAAKLLHGWLQNRHQTLFPMTLHFGTLDQRSRGLVVQVMALAATADGDADAEEQERITQALAGAGAGEAEHRLLAEALASPPPLGPLLREVQAARLGAHAYAASLLALDRHSRANRAWLDYLAARLGLPAEVISGLNRRQRAQGRMGAGVRPAPR
jgi:uncharacterized membrane protein YebE (DUF533 family)